MNLAAILGPVRPVLRGAAAVALVAAAATSGGAASAGAAVRMMAGGSPTVTHPARDGVGGTVPSMPNLEGVSCPAISLCLVVGISDGGAAGFLPLAASWDGRTWRWTQPPQPQADSGLDAVSCPSATACIAVGYDRHTDVGFGDEWDGRTWRTMPAMARPSFGTAGLSCVTIRFCIAVGGNQAASDEVWNGTAWSRKNMVRPAGSSLTDFTSVTCPIATSCMAVGNYQTASGKKPIAETWNGTAWTIQPAPSAIFQFIGVSCPHVNLCLAVGTGQSGGPAAVLWNGSTWQPISVPNPGSISTALTGVWCTSATNCMVVGGDGGTVGLSVAEAWTGGTSLKLLAAPRSGALYGVSCAVSSSCVAVGSPQNPLTSANNAALSWNGTSWRVIRENRSDLVANVSCANSSQCLAAGTFLDESNSQAALAEEWRGRAWRLVSPARLAGALGDISCASPSFCLATTGALALAWNGARWRPVSVPRDNYIFVLSCVTQRFCMALGGPTGFEVWHGQQWRILPEVPTCPAGSINCGYFALSCTGPSFCMTVGNDVVEETQHGEITGTAAAIWNGRTWRVSSTPDPGAFSGLSGVSCTSGTGCMTVGFFFGQHGGGHNLAMRWSGGKWRATTMPGDYWLGFGLPYHFGAAAAVACSRARSCMAIGSFRDTEFGSDRELAEVWNGTNWRITKPAWPAGAVIAGVSCATPAFCMAVGYTKDQLSLSEMWNGSSWRSLKTPSP